MTRRSSPLRRRWRLSLTAVLVLAATALAVPASAQWSATARGTTSITAWYPAITQNNGKWLECRTTYDPYRIGGYFGAVQFLYRDQIAPVFRNFMVYKTVNGTTQSQEWAPNPQTVLGDQNSYNYMFHDRGTNFYNLPTTNVAMSVYVRPVYDNGWLGPASNTITIYPNNDLSQSTCTS